jgi:hypothetical protein
MLFGEPTVSLGRLVNEYAGLAPTHLTGTPDGERISVWLHAQLESLGSNRYIVEDQTFGLSPGPWLPQGDGETGCELVLDGSAVPCYIVHRPSQAGTALSKVPMARVPVLEDSSYELSASEVLANVTAASIAAVVVINTKIGNRTTQPRPYDWNGTSPASPVPVVTVGWGWEPFVRRAKMLTSLRLNGTWATDGQTVRNTLATGKEPHPAGCDTSLGASLPLYVGTPVNGFFR